MLIGVFIFIYLFLVPFERYVLEAVEGKASSRSLQQILGSMSISSSQRCSDEALWMFSVLCEVSVQHLTNGQIWEWGSKSGPASKMLLGMPSLSSASSSSFLLMYTRGGGQAEGQRVVAQVSCVPDIHLHSWSSWLWPGLALAIVGIWTVIQQLKHLSFFQISEKQMLFLKENSP